ncbi:cardiolipin synthetase [Vibrio maritimus]|uniref:Cardiolipin synthetase n=1 Tax=Vibrio maritimus TaxID=990268 RepID=A0A090TS91_9VIBR|nr:cardiolipin synthetase [Vibrio maritimus]
MPIYKSTGIQAKGATLTLIRSGVETPPVFTMKYILLAVAIIVTIAYLTEPQYYQHDTESFKINKHTPGNIGNSILEVKGDAPSHLTGYYLLHDPIEALIARASLMSEAEHTIDIQYYIYKSDFTGNLLFKEAKKAANRGVRVRILLDDFGSFGIDDVLITLDQHPNIEVRLFNAFQRNRSVISQLAFGFGSTTRRMHNKALIVDNQLSIIGVET